MNKAQAKQRIKDDFYKATAVFAELAAAGRIKAPEGASVEGLRRHMSEEAAEMVEEHWVSFDPPAAEPNEDGAGDDDDGSEG